MDVISRLRRGVITSLAVGVLFYLGFSVWAEFSAVLDFFRDFRWALLAPAVGVVLVGYVFRFLRWQAYLRLLDLRVPVWDSLTIFLAGMSMTITPGKVGELLKSWLLKERCGAPVAQSAPVVVVERLTDLLALVALAGLGVGSFYAEGAALLVSVGAALLVVVAAVQSQALVLAVLRLLERAPVASGLVPRLREMYLSTRLLLSPRPLGVGLVLAMLAWGAECSSLWIVLYGGGADPSWWATSFVHSFSTVAGVVSPGGLGITDGLLVLLCQRLVSGVDQGTAVCAAFIVRLCTLWLGVGLGAASLLRFQREASRLP